MSPSNRVSAFTVLRSVLKGIGALLLCCAVGSVSAAAREGETETVPSQAQPGCHQQRLESSIAELETAPDPVRLEFYSALALHQCALEASDRQMLGNAAGLYESYLAQRPNAHGAAYNLAKLYEQLGRPDEAVRYFERAIQTDDPQRRLYLETYARFLHEKMGNWQQASRVYSMLVDAHPLADIQQTGLAALYAERGPDSLVGFLWELVDAGGSWHVADLAVGALESGSADSAELRMELLAIAALGLGRVDIETRGERFGESGLRERLAALSDDPVIGGGAAGIVRLHDLTRRILERLGAVPLPEGIDCATESICQQLEPRYFQWWRELGPRGGDPRRGVWPEDGFRALIRSVGVHMTEAGKAVFDQETLSTEYFRFAESYFRLAAELQPGEVDPSAVRELIRLEFESERVPNVDAVRMQYEKDVVSAAGDTGQIEGTFAYHKTLAEYYAYRMDRGDAAAAEAAVYQLQQARARSDQLGACARTAAGELPDPSCFTPEMEEMLARACAAAGLCSAPPPPPPPEEERYIGDDIRIGIGYDSETDLTGEFFWNFLEDSDSAYSLEGWKGNDSSGGLKFNYHWLADGVPAGTDAAGAPVYADGKVRKLFAAVDQNVFSDGKITFGGGSERDNDFWAVYASKSITGERLLGQTRESTMSGPVLADYLIDNHPVLESAITTTDTYVFAHPYEWGVGVRVGHYFEDALIRLRGGVDYEDGHYGAYQITGYGSIDKRFAGSSQGLSLRAEIVRKEGDFEVDKSDFRVAAYWSWDFGVNSRPAASWRNVQVQRMPDPSELPREHLSGIVNRQVTLSFDDDASSFRFDSAELTDGAKEALRQSVADLDRNRIIGKILIVGHTCSVGSDEYNQGLSERRAQSVYEFLVGQGVDASVLCQEGRGEAEPRYSNETEESRSRNRRVEVSFSAGQRMEYETLPVEPRAITAWERQEVPREAAWIRRALRNPIAHKRSVDYYRYNRVESVTESRLEIINQGPDAVDDAYQVEQDSERNVLPVLTNDSDPEFDFLEIVEPLARERTAHGEVELNGEVFLYTPDPGYCGTDSFVYVIEDRYVTEPHEPGERSEATVTIEVICNNPPVAVDDEFTVEKYRARTDLPVMQNDYDPDGDPISILVESVTLPRNGGSVEPGRSSIVYTARVPLVPGVPENCTDSFTYAIEDDRQNRSNTATVSITVANDLPLAMDDYDETARNAPVTIAVLGNDADDDPFTIVDVTEPVRLRGQAVLNANGTITYTPDGRYWGEDSFQYTVRDYCGEESTATVTVLVRNEFIPVPSPCTAPGVCPGDD